MVWARRIYFVAVYWPLRMVVLREVHAAWKSAHTLCNVCAGFHFMYTHEIGEEKIDTMHHSYVFVSQRGEGGWGETTSFRYLRMTPLCGEMMTAC